MNGTNIVLDKKESKIISQYFKGRPIWPGVLVMILGVVVGAIAYVVLGEKDDKLSIIVPIACVAVGFILGLIIILVRKYGKFVKGQNEVDKAISEISEQIKSGGFIHSNISAQDVSGVDPMIMVGPGKEPDWNVVDFRRKSIFRRRQKSLSAVLAKDPESRVVYYEKIGKDYRLRHSLVDATVFYFGEKQVYAFSVSVDLTTGYTYEHSSYEMFYEDISAINISGTKRKILIKHSGCSGKNEYIPIVFETFKLLAAGSCLEKRIVRYPDDIGMTAQLNGMRTLIRERKNEN